MNQSSWTLHFRSTTWQEVDDQLYFFRISLSDHSSDWLPLGWVPFNATLFFCVSTLIWSRAVFTCRVLFLFLFLLSSTLICEKWLSILFFKFFLSLVEENIQTEMDKIGWLVLCAYKLCVYEYKSYLAYTIGLAIIVELGFNKLSLHRYQIRYYPYGYDQTRWCVRPSTPVWTQISR